MKLEALEKLSAAAFLSAGIVVVLILTSFEARSDWIMDETNSQDCKDK